MLPKETILSAAREHLGNVTGRMRSYLVKAKNVLTERREIFKTLSNADKITEHILMQYRTRRIKELDQLKGSPYFVRCDVHFDGEKEERQLYFGKFGFEDADIYSWVTPASAMRFENPGAVSYLGPEGDRQSGVLKRKDTFLIVDNDIKFLATEDLDSPRQLIYQSHFSNRKTGFILPEIVAQMEKAQDAVIRAHHVGPFLISGPAGSGKTTLALHRVAYLAQSPDLAEKFPGRNMIVFVQDQGTRDYFAHLLPELGITDVTITTFEQWALEILGITGEVVGEHVADDSEQARYEYAKLSALASFRPREFARTQSFEILAEAYAGHFDPGQKAIFERQRKSKRFDRLDLIILLKSFRASRGRLGTVKDYYKELKNGRERKTCGFMPFEYSLAVVDEFQNYLPDQLELIRACVNERNRALVYVGDMAQQVRLGTIKDFFQIGENVEVERRVVLNKVYRNTQNILRYLQRLGYSVEIPESLKTGPEVVEVVLADSAAEIDYIRAVTAKNGSVSVGILAKQPEYLDGFRQTFAGQKNFHCMSMAEAQGVEFETVFLVGVDEKIFASDLGPDCPENLIRQKQRIDRDLLYVALTRAMNEMHNLGRGRLSELAKSV